MILHKMAAVGPHSLGRQHDSREPGVIAVPGRYFLLVMTVDSLTIEPLPPAGQLVVGRSKAADLRLVDAAAAPRHLRLDVGGRITIEDLGSASGTRVAGASIPSRIAVEILPGEPIAVGSTVLMVREMTSEERPQRIWSHGAFELRVDDECERAGRSDAAFALVRLVITADPVMVTAPSQILGILAAHAPSPHAVGVYGGDEYELLWVGTTAAQAEERRAALEFALARDGLMVRTAFAVFPEDGRSAAVLLEQANARLFAGDQAQASQVEVGAAALCLAPADQALIAAAAGHERPLLLLGESGSGKETWARAIHARSLRAHGPFCVVEAGVGPVELERALFGGRNPEEGIWARSHGGTLLVVNADHLSTAIALRLMRQPRAAGPEHPRTSPPPAIPVSKQAPRLILARTLKSAQSALDAARGPASSEPRRHFRPDPSEIIAAEVLSVPALRDRLDQLTGLTDGFVTQAASVRGRCPLSVSAPAREWLERRSWLGNLRELKNVVDRAVANAGDQGELEFGEPVPGAELRSANRGAGPADLRGAVAEVVMQRTEVPAGSLGGERDRIVAALTACAFNQSRAAERLGISRRTLVARLNQFGINRPLKPASGA